MFITIILLLLGLALVLKGADFLVDGASSLAKRLRISEMVIGLTVVALGTSAPELAVNIFSSLQGRSELVLGNVIGSNMFNTLFILGVSGLIYPLTIQRNSVRKEIPFSLLSLVLFFVLANDQLIFKGSSSQLSRFDGVILLLMFGFFLYYTYILSREKTEAVETVTSLPLGKTWLYIILGVVGLFGGGRLVVDHAVIIARELSVSEKLIGLTIVSAGTSLPELATSAVAAFKKRCDLAVGNVVGSNIFNTLFVIGVSIEISPVPYNTTFNHDLLMLTLGTLLLLAAMFTSKIHKLDRWEALVLLFAFIVYMVYIILRK